MVTAITISTILCSVRFRKKSDPDPSKSLSSDRTVENCDPSSENLQSVETTGLQASAVQSGDRKENDSEESQARDLPLPPARQLGGTYYCKKVMTNSTSMRNLTKDVSVKIQRSMSMAMKRDKEDKLMNHKTKLGKNKNDDSVWMKTIILGEKCKVPDEEEAIIYESKGKKVQAFHPRTPSTISLSRQNSSIDFTAIPPSDRDKGILVRKEEEAFS
ncbi:hypothetical protein K2173_015726 [Erythroxylum novogranatense]|uniref:Uncharacterized protein n=1 Tax=Erythroxylum novogranatense TaxID=1862640 RepID=A0AAV8SEF7_9ROSI|nr:hypothetical protein K2173_015726 [Erythroxylum novogranatense]